MFRIKINCIVYICIIYNNITIKIININFNPSIFTLPEKGTLTIICVWREKPITENKNWTHLKKKIKS
jgi:hypothetical protein